MAGKLPKGDSYLKSLRGMGDLYGYYPILNKILEVANDSRSSAADLANVFVHDHAFTSKILRLGNSAYYSYRRKITTLTLAIVVMGFQTIKNLALSISLYETLRHKKTGKLFHFNDFWSHSLATAIISHWLAQRVKASSAEEAFLAGFLHDIGKLIVTIATPDRWDAVVRRVDEGMSLEMAELEELGVGHAEIGAYIADIWSFPPLLIDVLRGHGRQGVPDSCKSRNELIDIVHVANLAAGLRYHLQGSDRVELKQVQNAAQRLFGIGAEELDEELDRLDEQVIKTARELQIPLQSVSDDALSDDELSHAPAKVQQQYRELLKRYEKHEKQLRLSQDLIEGFAQTESPEVILMMLAEGLFREVYPGRVIVFAHNQKRRAVEGIVGYGIDWQWKIKDVRYSFTDHSNLVVASLKQNRVILPRSVPIQSGTLHLDERLVQEFGITRVAALPLPVWGRPFACVLLGQAEPEAELTEEVVGMARTFIYQASTALERLAPKTGAKGSE